MKTQFFLIVAILCLLPMYSQEYDPIITISCDMDKIGEEEQKYNFELEEGRFVKDREGNSRSAIEFDGEFTMLTLNDDLSYEVAPQISFTMWIKRDDFVKHSSSNVVNLLNNSSVSEDLNIFFRELEVKGEFHQELHMRMKDTYLWYRLGSFQELNDWMFMAFSFDFDNKELLYCIDGKFGKFKIDDLHSSSSSWFIGARENRRGHLFKGILDDIKIYDQALTQEDIEAIYESDYELEPDKTDQYSYQKDQELAKVIVRVGDVDFSNYNYPKGFDVFCDESHNYHFGVSQYLNLIDYPGTDKIHVPSSYISTSDKHSDGYSNSRMSKNTDSKDIIIEYPEPDFEIENIEIQAMFDGFQTVPRNKNEIFQIKIDGKRMNYVERIFQEIHLGKVNKIVNFGILPEDFYLFKDGQVTINIDDPVSGLGDGYIIDFIKILINRNDEYVKCQPHIKGFVKDDKGAPIEGVLVSSNAASETVTDSNGYYDMQGLIGVNIVHTEHQKYFSEQKIIELYNDNIKELDFIMKKRPEEVDVHFVKEIKEKGSVNLYGIYFESNGDIPKPESDSTLNDLAEFIQTHSNIKIEIIGHTDNIGSVESNLDLSDRRAKSVANWLEEKNVNIENIIPKGLGEGYPVTSNKTEVGRSLNRRVELRIVK